MNRSGSFVHRNIDFWQPQIQHDFCRIATRCSWHDSAPNVRLYGRTRSPASSAYALFQPTYFQLRHLSILLGSSLCSSLIKFGFFLCCQHTYTCPGSWILVLTGNFPLTFVSFSFCLTIRKLANLQIFVALCRFRSIGFIILRFTKVMIVLAGSFAFCPPGQALWILFHA